MSQTPRLHCFTTAYIEAALYDHSGDRQHPLDAASIEPGTLAQMRAESAAFYEANAQHIHCVGAPRAQDFDSPAGESDLEAARAGFDFWMTRQGHGAHFMDGSWPEPAAAALYVAANAYDPFLLSVGQDGQIYN